MGDQSNLLQTQAEALRRRSAEDISRLSLQEIQRLIGEFQSLQKELELENETLNQTCRELSLSREHYAQLYNSGTVGYLTLNRDDVVQHANLAAAALLNCPVETLIGKKFGEFIYADDHPAYYAFIDEFSTQATDTALTVRLKSGRKIVRALECPGLRLTDCSQESCSQNPPFIYLECSHAVNRSCPNTDICLIVHDISERKFMQESIACLNEKLEQKIARQTEALLESNLNLQNKIRELDQFKNQLLEREAKLNAIFNAAVEGIITIDKAGTVVSVNSSIETIFGYRPDELIGGSINKLIPDDKRKKHDAHIQAKSANVLDRIRHIDGLRKDGTTVPLDISIAEFTIDGVCYFTAIVRDVSLRKRQEQQEKAHLDELAHVTRLGLMGEMASGIAHEVNQPLTAIAGYTQACLNFMQQDPPDLAKLQEILPKTHQQALKAGQIIHRMREFVTFKTVHRSSVAINELVNVCIGLCAGDLKSSNIVQHLNLAKNLPVIFVDSVQIEQVLLNLIRNSLDALKLLPEQASRLISIQTALDEHRNIVVRVKDNGLGIASTDREKILTPFYTTKKSGMGMGLPISHSIIKAHEGSLSFNSKPGKGTTFYVTLPTRGE